MLDPASVGQSITCYWAGVYHQTQPSIERRAKGAALEALLRTPLPQYSASYQPSPWVPFCNTVFVLMCPICPLVTSPLSSGLLAMVRGVACVLFLWKPPDFSLDIPRAWQLQSEFSKIDWHVVKGAVYISLCTPH